MLGSATRPTRLATGHCPVASRVVGTGHCPVASPGRRLEPLVFPSKLLELSAELKLGRRRRRDVRPRRGWQWRRRLRRRRRAASWSRPGHDGARGRWRARLARHRHRRRGGSQGGWGNHRRWPRRPIRRRRRAHVCRAHFARVAGRRATRALVSSRALRDGRSRDLRLASQDLGV